MHRVMLFLLTFILTLNIKSKEPGEFSKKTILVVGGAGYIGSQINEMLYQDGYQTIILDNLSGGNLGTVLNGTFIRGDISNTDLLEEIFSTYSIDAVMHFAALKYVGESVKDPLRYYINNVANTLNLLDAMKRHNVKIFIFSSSAAIFGVPVQFYMNEDHPCIPINPYGQSKYMIETILKDLDQAYGFRYCCLRYFNAAGGDPSGKIKNFNDTDSNLIPLVLKKLLKNDPCVTIFGTDFPTPDGTCIRDYVHVVDLGSAHIAVLKKLLNGSASACYNLGSGNGFSVREVLAAIEKVTNKKLTIIEGSRRLGDPPTLVATSKKAQKELDWHPKYPFLEEMIEHSWRAMQHP